MHINVYVLKPMWQRQGQSGHQKHKNAGRERKAAKDVITLSTSINMKKDNGISQFEFKYLVFPTVESSE